MRNKNTTPRAAFNPDRSHDAGCITRVNSVCECNCSKAAELDVERFDEVTGGYDDVDHARAAKRLNADLRAMDATPRVGHTPGPWQIKCGAIVGKSGVNVAGASIAPPYDEFAANARLIAAAPDLLAVCMEILEHGTDDWDARMKTLRAAIARATR